MNRVFFVGEGRLGNQIFQYLFLNKYFSSFGAFHLYTTSFKSIWSIFEKPANCTNIYLSRSLERVFRRIILPVFLRRLLGVFKFADYLVEDDLSSKYSSGILQVRSGPPLSNHVFVDGGYYQDLERLLSPKDFSILKIRPELIEQAHEFLKEKFKGREIPKTIAHVRRGDYLNHKTYGLDNIVLPRDYYINAFQNAREMGAEEIIVVTDDASWCTENFKDFPGVCVVSTSEVMDFVILTMAEIAIVSNSTFSFAAACVGPDVKKIFAPEYWFGFEVKKWLPPNFRTSESRFHYIEF